MPTFRLFLKIHIKHSFKLENKKVHTGKNNMSISTSYVQRFGSCLNNF